MNMRYYAQAKGRGGITESLEGAGQGRSFGGGGFGGDPILMSYSGEPNALAGSSMQPGAQPLNALGGGMQVPEAAPQAMPPADGNHAARLMHVIMTRAKTREEGEQMLRDFVQNAGDAGYEAADMVAKQLGIRTPWDRDFSAPPAQRADQFGPSGRPRPLNRGGY